MSLKWEELEISPAELEELLNFDLLSTWAIDISRVFLLRQAKYRNSLLFTEGCYLFLVFILLFPINLIIFRNFGWLTNNTNGLILVLASTGFLSCLLLLFLNYHLWLKAKKLKVFAIIIKKVNQYNDLIEHLKLAAELNSLSSQKYGNKKAQETINNSSSEIELETALTLTKNSLIKSIELEKIITRDRNLAKNRYQLLANLETSLVNLGSLSQPESDDYQQLLSESIEIGLSVHQEIRKTKTLRESITE
ncbi:MAG: hypothetical protein QNJ70_10060 [Xenococcaceae cyanobacterium MO_207.B15]|nr:hypothetical protein [Xenococcaceae cyanobacterium MO_207.B15]